MKILPVTENTYYSNIKPYSKNATVNQTSFKGNYEDVIWNVWLKDLKSTADVEKAITNLYSAAMKENGTVKTPLQAFLSDWLQNKGTYLVEELCKPIAKVRPEFRDIVFGAYDDILPIIRKADDDLVYIFNLGKHGFWNNLFDRESASNDVRLIFNSDRAVFEVSTDSKGNLVSEQIIKSGHWTKNTYSKLYGERITQKTGDAGDVFVVPQIA